MRYRPYALCWAMVWAVVTLTCSGCWDRQEINERAFVMGVGIDVASEGETEREVNKPSFPFILDEPGAEIGALAKKSIVYLLTYEIAVLRALAQGGGGGAMGGPGGGGVPPSWAISTTASTMQAATTALNLRLFRPLFYGHQRILVIGEEAAHEGLQTILDFFEREVRASRKLRVAIAAGKARDVISIRPLLEPLASVYMFRLLQSLPYNSFGWDTTLNDVMIELHDSGDTVMSRLQAAKSEVDAGGAAVIKDWRLVGWLDNTETQGYCLARGRSIVGEVSIAIPNHVSEEISFVYRRSYSRIRARTTEGSRPSFHVEVRVEGSITEETSFVEFSREFIDWAESALAAEVTRRVRSAIDKLQKQYQIDALKLGRALETADPKLWRQMGGQWNDIYPHVPIYVHTTAKVRRTGSVL